MPTLNGLDISDGTKYIVTEITYRSLPPRNMEAADVSRTPGAKLINSEWGSKEINIKGHIFASSPSVFRDNVDNLQKYATGRGIALAMDTDRSFTVTLSQMDIPTQFFNSSYAPFDMTLIAYDPFAYANSVTISGSTVSGTNSVTVSPTISGSVFSVPTLTITPIGGSSGFSGVNQFDVTYVNTGEKVSVSGTLNYQGAITIDYNNFNVTVAGVASDYTGVFSRWEPGTGPFTITVASGINQQFKYLLSYQPRYYQ